MQFYSSATTLGAPSKPVEIKIPLYFSDGGGAGSNQTAAGGGFLTEGQSSGFVSGIYSNQKFHTLNSNWPASTKYAFEATMACSGPSTTVYATLWDMTSNTQVTASQVSTTSTTATVLRSGQFTLTPGHQYGVSAWTSNSSYSATFIDASLIVFPN